MSDSVRVISVKLTPVGRAQPFVFDPQGTDADATPRIGDAIIVHTDGATTVGTVVASIPQLNERRQPPPDLPTVSSASRRTKTFWRGSGIGSAKARRIEWRS